MAEKSLVCSIECANSSGRWAWTQAACLAYISLLGVVREKVRSGKLASEVEIVDRLGERLRILHSPLCE
jgi:hypothetical protein